MSKAQVASNVLKNVEVYWVKIDPENPVEPFGKLQWEVQVRTTDKGTADEWASRGLPVKPDEYEGDKYFKIALKKLAMSKAGKKLKPPRCVDGKLKELDPNIVGNGSIANVQYNPREWDMGGKQGIVYDLMAIQVVSLVEFGGSANEFDIVDLGEEEDEDTQDSFDSEEGTEEDDNF